MIPNRSASWAGKLLLAGFLVGPVAHVLLAQEGVASSPDRGSSSQQPVSFEAATIKPVKQDNYKPIGLYVYPGGRITVGQSTLKMLLEYAFHVQSFQITGGPQWINEDLFEIAAVPPDSAESRKYRPRHINDPPTDEQRAMLQALLVERFGLKFHRVSKDGEVFFLFKGKGALALEKAQHEDYAPVLAIGGYGYGGMSGQSVSLPFVAMRLSQYLDRPVLDRTGLNGLYDFKLDPASEDAAHETRNSFLDGIFQSVAKLGLNLKSGRAPVESIVIEAVTRPTAN